MTKEEARRLLEEATKRLRASTGLDPQTLLFTKQRDFAMDTGKLKAACCSRRAGKSYALAYLLVAAAIEFPGSTPIFITMAREMAKDIIWPPLQDLEKLLTLGMDFKHHTGEVRFPNGSIIKLTGAGSVREINKCRGPSYPLVVIDEAQVFPKSVFNYMVHEVFQPAVMDYDGSILATGTPNASCTGAFYDISVGKVKGWTTHSWTLRDNTFTGKKIPKKVAEVGGVDAYIDQYLAGIRENRGLSATDPAYLREFEGKWVRDGTDLVFNIDPETSYTDGLSPEVPWRYILGVDVGFKDPMAFVVVAYSREAGQAVVIESYIEDHMIPSACAAEIEEICGRYKIDRIVMDTGGIGKGYAEECKQKYGLNIFPAQKAKKAAFLEFLNGDLRTGGLKISRNCESLMEEMLLLQWDIRKKANGVFDFDKSFADHQSDALLYAWRECGHSQYKPSEHGAKEGSKEWADAQEKAYRDSQCQPREEDNKPWFSKLF